MTTHSIDKPLTEPDESSPRYAGWRVVAACYLVALCCWGFALYGHGVYLTELNRLHGWSTASISVGITGFYLLTATLVVFVGDAMTRFGPRCVMLIGAGAFGSALALLAFIDARWQLYVVYALMAVGAATMHVGAISTVLGLWFDRKRPLAVSLALNGASSGGIMIAPAMVLAIAADGFSHAVLAAAAAMSAILLPVIALWIDRPVIVPPRPNAAPPARATTRRNALRNPAFWSVAVPFALALTAQVGFLVHQIAILQPAIGRATAGFSVAALTIAAIAGRFVLGALAGRIDMRTFTACSMASQAAMLLALMATSDTAAIIVICVVFGLSAGNLITLPSLVIQREFDPASFSMLVGLSWAISQFTYAFGPGLLGAMRDWTGGYTAPLMLCAALDIAAAALILIRPGTLRRAPT